MRLRSVSVWMQKSCAHTSLHAARYALVYQFNLGKNTPRWRQTGAGLLLLLCE